MLGERFEVLNHVVWAKHDGNGNGMHSRACKQECRGWFPLDLPSDAAPRGKTDKTLFADAV